jgi:hypothetical protein
MKTHLITTLILVAIISLCVVMVSNSCVFLGIMSIVLISFTYSMIYIGVSRNITNKKIKP